jgi:hypothetical protein
MLLPETPVEYDGAVSFFRLATAARKQQHELRKNLMVFYEGKL